MEKIRYLHQYDILDLQDNNLQLRYFLGGFNSVEKKYVISFGGVILNVHVLRYLMMKDWIKLKNL